MRIFLCPKDGTEMCSNTLPISSAPSLTIHIVQDSWDIVVVAHPVGKGMEKFCVSSPSLT